MSSDFFGMLLEGHQGFGGPRHGHHVAGLEGGVGIEVDDLAAAADAFDKQALTRMQGFGFADGFARHLAAGRDLISTQLKLVPGRAHAGFRLALRHLSLVLLAGLREIGADQLGS
jgi:hypothetical protein